MKALLIGAAAAALAMGIAPALAQPAPAPPPGVAQGTEPLARTAPGERVRVRVKSNRVMTRDEAVENVRKLFAKLDTNRDGVVTRQEVDAPQQKMTAATGVGKDLQKRLAQRGSMMGDRNALFDRLDTNHDGAISRQEFTSAARQIRREQVISLPYGAVGGTGDARMEHKKARMRGAAMGRGFGGHLFETADSNHDGRLTLQEAESAALAHFDKADLNHDGRITADERAQAHAMKRPRGAS